MRIKARFLVFAAIQVGCASNVEQFSSKIDLDGASDQISVTVPSTVSVLLSPYTQGDNKGNIETVICAHQEKRSIAHVLIFSEKGFDSSDPKFCEDWAMQVFLADGYNTLAVNLPGQGKSTGLNDFYGPGDLRAVAEVTDKIMTEQKFGIVGVWGYSKASIIASFYAKKRKEVSWLILGGGIYDLEKYHKGLAPGSMKESLDQLYLVQKDELYEARSIAWDIENLPKNIYIYHAIGDPVIPEAQAVAFRDGLAVKEYNVNYFGLQENTHDLEQKKHQLVLKKILENLHKPLDQARRESSIKPKT